MWNRHRCAQASHFASINSRFPTYTSTNFLRLGSYDTQCISRMNRLSLGSELSHSQLSLFPQHHDLESLKVGQSTLSLSGSQLLGPVGRGPLAVNVSSSPLLGNGTGSRTSWQFLQDDGGQDNLGQSDGLSVDVGSVNQDLKLVKEQIRGTGEKQHSLA